MAHAPPALEVEDLTKYYGDYCAVDHISFCVPRGSVVGLLGPNGAGKTTTTQMLLGITETTSGEIRYFGDDFRKNRRRCLQRINYTSAYSTLQGRLTVYENLRTFAFLYSVRSPKAKIIELAEYFGIRHLFDQIFWGLSAGQRTRVNLVKALINDPELILMDEPTASLDPDIRDKTISFIERLRAERGLSILYTSHNMDEVDRLCDEVIFLDRGTIVRQDTPENLATALHRTQLVVHVQGDRTPIETALQAVGYEFTFDSDRRVIITAEGAQIPDVLSTIAGIEGIAIVDVDIRKPSLEGVFLDLARNAG